MPRSQAIQEGKKLVLSCRTRRLPDIRYRWVKDDIEIPGANRPDLVLEPVRMRDFGRYVCRVWDKSGAVTSDSADIDVFPAPNMSKYHLSSEIQGKIVGTGRRFHGQIAPSLVMILSHGHFAQSRQSTLGSSRILLIQYVLNIVGHWSFFSVGVREALTARRQRVFSPGRTSPLLQ